MAVLIGPLFSLGARQKFGGALVYFPYKGQNVVRQLVKPANPNTTAQQTQRGYMADAVEAWHTIGFTAADVSAFNRWATASAPKLSGYNLFTRAHVKADIDSKDTDFPYEVVPDNSVAGTITLDFKGTAGKTYKCYMGTSKTSQLTEVTANDLGGGVFDADFTGLTAGVTYYFYIYEDATFGHTRSGLYVEEAT